MSIILKLFGWTGLPQWAIELLVIGAVILAIWLSGVFHEKAIVQRVIEKQQVEVEKRVIVTDHSYDQELTDLRTYRAAHPEHPVRLCNSPRPTPTAAGPTSTAADGVQQVPAGDSGLRPEREGPDISGMLEALAASSDAVSAGLRRRQELEP